MSGQAELRKEGSQRDLGHLVERLFENLLDFGGSANILILVVDRKKSKGSGKTKGSPHEDFVKALSSEERLLITLRDELYSGSWQNLKQDLTDRLHGKPYIFKLTTRIEEDLKRIEKLERYEQEHSVNLARYVEKEKE